MAQVGMTDPKSDVARRKARFVDDAGALRLTGLYGLEDSIRATAAGVDDVAAQLADLTQTSVRRLEVLERHISALEVANGAAQGAAIKPDRGKRAVGKVGK